MSSAQEQGTPDVTNLTGIWVGSYFQHDRPHPIRAELVQEPREPDTGACHRSALRLTSLMIQAER